MANRVTLQKPKVARVQLKDGGGGTNREPKRVGKYFLKPNSVEFIPSGCKLLDLALGGGWVIGRIANLVGDKSTGKTLLAIEACANFAHKYPKGLIRYKEAEAAFDTPYAAALGLPVKRVDFGNNSPIFTVEDLFNDLTEFITKVGTNRHGLYILDSMDALSDNDEQKGEFGKDSYGARKPKLLGQLFRRLVQKLEKTKIHVLIVSQVRDNIGVAFGDKHTRSGGRALDFYATHIVWLAHLGQIKRTKLKVERTIGNHVRAKVKKNKIGPPFREAEFPVIFSYGVDDTTASIEFLVEVDRIELLGLTKTAAQKLLKTLDKLPDSEYHDLRQRANRSVTSAWREIETRFLPVRKKYA